MKKRNMLWLAVAILILSTSACVEMKYEAYITIANIGNLPMIAWVGGDQATIAAYDSLTWAITLEEKNETIDLLLEAEPLDSSDHDEITVTLIGDRDIQTWLTGWDAYKENAKPQKKQSSLIKGTPDKPLSSFRR